MYKKDSPTPRVSVVETEAERQLGSMGKKPRGHILHRRARYPMPLPMSYGHKSYTKPWTLSPSKVMSWTITIEITARREVQNLVFVGLQLDRVSLAQKNKRAMSFLKLSDLVFIEVVLKPTHVVKWYCVY